MSSVVMRSGPQRWTALPTHTASFCALPTQTDVTPTHIPAVLPGRVSQRSLAEHSPLPCQSCPLHWSFCLELCPSQARSKATEQGVLTIAIATEPSEPAIP